jgi:uncharacterized Zn finger protein (UPF0148 family)
MINPGWTAKVRRERFHVEGMTMLRCPKCKKPLGATKGTLFYKKCESCGRWVLLIRKKITAA